MKKSVKVFFYMLVLFSACDEDDWDYRNRFTGEYNFTIINTHTTFIGDASSGHIESYKDTSEYSGSVKKSFLHLNRINVDWGSGTVGTEDGHKVERNKTPLKVDEEGNLEYPEISDGFYKPTYIHGDTIRFNFYTGLGMAHSLYSLWEVMGLKSDN